MSDFMSSFDPTAVDTTDERGSGDFSPLPNGDYLVQIIEAEMKDTSTGGEMLRMTLEVLDGPQPGRRVWENLNVVNKNPDTEKYARRDLATIMAAIGQGPTNDLTLLCGRPFKVTLKTNPGREYNGKTYDPSNGVKRYHGKAGAPASKTPAAAPTPRPAAPAATARAWANKAPAARSLANGDQPPF
ncbi:DUF669 domain-containing protein [Methylobacterium sp. WL19]|uniref:DUF669 domain-containing protein n=1 Tax=Methylobacterium sp. WL19 TaxID=2603896 RepID=UPI0011C756B7|nr:DUF669 domain-containing protein [Methylobacterium sp. WL19]TXN33924.1 DUF669 domain-containing protein [Methylobacterium sp. WL19]